MSIPLLTFFNVKNSLEQNPSHRKGIHFPFGTSIPNLKKFWIILKRKRQMAQKERKKMITS